MQAEKNLSRNKFDISSIDPSSFLTTKAFIAKGQSVDVEKN